MMTAQPSASLLERISERLARGSAGDRQYERPMNWNEAEELVRVAVEQREALVACRDFLQKNAFVGFTMDKVLRALGEIGEDEE